jgi:hypothetical protein
MRDDNPDTTQAIRILRDRGYDGMTVSGAIDILVGAGFRPSALSAVSIDDAIFWANQLRAARITTVPTRRAS